MQNDNPKCKMEKYKIFLKFFLQRRIPAYRQAGFSEGQFYNFTISNQFLIFPPEADPSLKDNFKNKKIIF